MTTVIPSITSVPSNPTDADAATEPMDTAHTPTIGLRVRSPHTIVVTAVCRRNADTAPDGPLEVLGGLNYVDDPQPTEFRLLRPCDVVEILGVSRSWLYDAANTGRIPCVRLGGNDGPVGFRADELEAWLEASRVKPTAARASATARSDRKLGLLPPAAGP